MLFFTREKKKGEKEKTTVVERERERKHTYKKTERKSLKRDKNGKKSRSMNRNCHLCLEGKMNFLLQSFYFLSVYF
jgi:hypothetical protein